MSAYKPVVDIKKDLPPNFARTLFLEHTSDHSGSVSVFTDGSKSDTGVGSGVVFPEFCRGGSLPVVAPVFTAVILVVLFALNSYSLSSNPLVLSALEWLYLLYMREYRIEFSWVPVLARGSLTNISCPSESDICGERSTG